MGMRKKMKLFIAMVSVGALLGTMPVMAAEQPELPTKVQDIANGSDELYGEFRLSMAQIQMKDFRLVG